MRKRYSVAALPAPLDRLIYDPARPIWPRAFLYLLDKALLVLRGVLSARRFRANVVFCETAHHALAGLGIARILGIRCVWDSHGNVSLFCRSLGKGRVYSWVARSLETFLGNRVDHLITVSPADADAYADMGLPREKIDVIPQCVGLAQSEEEPQPVLVEPRVPEVPALLFFGSFRYAPNLDALEFINGSIAPYLERRGIRCEIWVAGRDIPERPYHAFVRPLGFVPDIHGRIRCATVTIVPVRKGVGTLTKVIDAMACGTPVVMFAFAQRGIPGVRDGVHAYVASTEDEFLHLVVRALEDEPARRAIAREARELVQQKYVWEAYLDRLDAILREPARLAVGG